MKDIYHYTSVGGFKGMIENNSIRMTKSDFLNDPTDCQLFITLIEKYLDTNKQKYSEVLLSIGKNAEEVRQLYEEKQCDLLQYIEYIHRHISLYVLSLTQVDDGMNMWNYYGQGGMQLHFSMDKLIESLKQTFVSEKEFLTATDVIYANAEHDVSKINVPNFEEIALINRDSDNIFNDHNSFIKEKSNYEVNQLYSIKSLDTYIDTYLKSYLHTLSHLIKGGEITISTKPEEVFEKVFNNDLKLNNFLIWKHDLSLYMLVLSALIKSDTYEYENEYRIVYFEYNTSLDKTKKEEYMVKHITSGDFICPYITFERESNEAFLQDILKEVTVSPATKNLPINDSSYLETLKRYIMSKKFSDDVNVKFSKHTIRW